VKKQILTTPLPIVCILAAEESGFKKDQLEPFKIIFPLIKSFIEDSDLL